MAVPHLKWIEIDLEAIRWNLRWTRSQLAPGAELMAVVKADAYGHGAERVASLAVREGASRLGVFTVAEAAALRAAGIRAPIVVLCPPLPAEAAEAARLGLEPTVDSTALARALERAARRPVRVHVDLDYGLGRWGIEPRGLERFLKALRPLRRVRVAGLSAHLDYVPGKNAIEAEEKLGDFARRADEARAAFPELKAHCANSAVLLDFPHRQMDMVRVGNLVYGINRTRKEAPLRKPWALHARIVSLREVGKGRPIGYGSEYLAPRRMRVASLPVGYSDGLTMEPAQRVGIRLQRGHEYWGWLKGRKVPFAGPCGISHVLVDVTAAPGARIGDPVAVPMRRTAANPRIPRVYRGQ